MPLDQDPLLENRKSKKKNQVILNKIDKNH